MAQPVITARSRQPLWHIVVLIPGAALLLWMTKESYNPDFALFNKGEFLNLLSPDTRAAIFGFITFLAVTCVFFATKRYLYPRVELILDDVGLTTTHYWGRGTLPWPNITRIYFDGPHHMRIEGKDAAGVNRRLLVAIFQLDHSVETILEAIYTQRPDIVIGSSR